MIDTKDYIQRLEDIRQRRMMPRVVLAQHLSLSYNTYIRFVSGNGISYRTLMKIKDYVEQHENSNK